MVATLTDKPMSENGAHNACIARGIVEVGKSADRICDLVMSALDAKDAKHQEEVAALRAEVERYKASAILQAEADQATIASLRKQLEDAQTFHHHPLCNSMVNKHRPGTFGVTCSCKIVHNSETRAIVNECDALKKQLEEARGLVGRLEEKFINLKIIGEHESRLGKGDCHGACVVCDSEDGLKLIKEWRERA